MYETDFNWAELDCGLMDMLGQGQEPTFLDWAERELVGLDGERFIASVTHSRRSRGMDINKIICSTMMHSLDCLDCVQCLD